MQVQSAFYTHTHPHPHPHPASASVQASLSASAPPPSDSAPSNPLYSSEPSAQPARYVPPHFHGDTGAEMNPYNQHSYAGGYGYQQPPQQRYPPPQSHTLPPMQMSQGPPPPLAVPNSGLVAYPPHPPPGIGGIPPHLQQSGPNYAPPPERKQLSFSGRTERYSYSLRVEQQPQRARMCGFGDKDRRPITPPPCVRLVITDINTGKEVGPNEVDGTFFVLQVDIWADTGHNEVNLVRASSSSPAVSISTATTTSYPPAPERPTINEMGQQMIYYTPDGHQFVGPVYQRASMSSPIYSGMHPQQAYIGGAGPLGTSSPSNNMMYTRNLIGSLTVNAASLTDREGKSGYWFVLQDLSVRTEGWFRLKMNFVDVGAGPSSSSGLNKGRAPVLAWVFSDKFQVYSAKKFPGVIESTPLSKCFAAQGIKIPIRKDVKAEGKDEGRDDDGDD